MSFIDRAAAAATRAVANALGDHYGDQFAVQKFARHRDGYLHARVVVDGERAYYFHLRFGSWLAPGTSGTLKEPEAVLGGQLGREVKYTLSEYAQRFERAERDGKEPLNGPADTPEEPGRDGPAEPAAGVPEGGDRADAGERV